MALRRPGVVQRALRPRSTGPPGPGPSYLSAPPLSMIVLAPASAIGQDAERRPRPRGIDELDDGRLVRAARRSSRPGRSCSPAARPSPSETSPACRRSERRTPRCESDTCRGPADRSCRNVTLVPGRRAEADDRVVRRRERPSRSSASTSRSSRTSIRFLTSGGCGRLAMATSSAVSAASR